MNSEMMEKLESQMTEELHDVLHYHCLFKEAQEMADSRLYHGFYAIMKDEHTHAMFLLKMLEHHGYDIDNHPEEKDLLKKVEELK